MEDYKSNFLKILWSINDRTGVPIIVSFERTDIWKQDYHSLCYLLDIEPFNNEYYSQEFIQQIIELIKNTILTNQKLNSNNFSPIDRLQCASDLLQTISYYKQKKNQKYLKLSVIQIQEIFDIALQLATDNLKDNIFNSNRIVRICSLCHQLCKWFFIYGLFDLDKNNIKKLKKLFGIARLLVDKIKISSYNDIFILISFNRDIIHEYTP